MKRHLILLGCATVLMLAAASALFSLRAEHQLRPFVRGSWQEILRAHAGRPTMIHFWGVTCGPCKVELPLLGEFMKKEPGLDVVLISADLVPDLPDATWTMLQKASAEKAENWIFNDGFAERLRFEVDPTWQGEIPRTVLIGRDGQQTTMEGVAEFAEIKSWLEKQKRSQ